VRDNVLLLRIEVGISDDKKFLQSEADNRDADATQINSNIMMYDGMTVTSNLISKLK
jgi:hypothetical protein